jgi:hypothetical protein
MSQAGKEYIDMVSKETGKPKPKWNPIQTIIFIIALFLILAFITYALGILVI